MDFHELWSDKKKKTLGREEEAQHHDQDFPSKNVYTIPVNRKFHSTAEKINSLTPTKKKLYINFPTERYKATSEFYMQYKLECGVFHLYKPSNILPFQIYCLEALMCLKQFTYTITAGICWGIKALVIAILNPAL